MTEINPSLLSTLLDYNQSTGNLTWRRRSVDMFHGNCRIASAWNSRYAGRPAFSAMRNGYNCGSIFGKVFQAHRVIWALVNGTWPESEIDHINHDRSDNRIANLRLASRGENARNQGQNRNNTSGASGVYFVKRRSKWLARVVCDGVSVYEGYFHTRDDAITAREAQMAAFGYHPNHGRAF